MEKRNKWKVCEIGCYLLTAVGMTLGVSQILVYGSEYVSGLIDQMAQGQKIVTHSRMLQIGSELGLLVLIGFLCSFLKSLSSGLMSMNITIWLKKAATAQVMRIKESALSGKSTGALINRLTGDLGVIERYLQESFFSLLSAVITVIVVGTSIYRLNSRIMFQTAFLCMFVLIIAFVTSKRLSLLAGGRRGRMDRLLGLADDFLRGIVTGRSYNLYGIMEEKIEAAANEVLENEYRRTRISSHSWLLQTVSQWFPTFAMIAMVSWDAKTTHLSTGEITYVVLMANRLLKPFSDIPVLLNETAEAYASMKRIRQVFSYEAESDLGKGEIPMMDSEYAVEFDGVCFSYGERKVLNQTSFQIKNRQIAAFVGASGGGKSTIFNIFCGFLEGYDGAYRLFGKESQAYSLSRLRDCFSLVSQETFLFRGTILENIACGRPGADMQEVIQACKTACIHDDIQNMPEGYLTVLAENGGGLSGGEKQRISLARALVKDAPILLLDEPTSALDARTEAVISEAIANLKGKKTIIMIAHRLSTVSQADRIFVLEQGNVAESGNEAMLMSKKGVYYHLRKKEQC